MSHVASKTILANYWSSCSQYWFMQRASSDWMMYCIVYIPIFHRHRWPCLVVLEVKFSNFFCDYVVAVFLFQTHPKKCLTVFVCCYCLDQALNRSVSKVLYRKWELDVTGRKKHSWLITVFWEVCGVFSPKELHPQQGWVMWGKSNITFFWLYHDMFK